MHRNLACVISLALFSLASDVAQAVSANCLVDKSKHRFYIQVGSTAQTVSVAAAFAMQSDHLAQDVLPVVSPAKLADAGNATSNDRVPVNRWIGVICESNAGQGYLRLTIGGSTLTSWNPQYCSFEVDCTAHQEGPLLRIIP